jgi:uncharacterized protein YeeX (DUF496 family)
MKDKYIRVRLSENEKLKIIENAKAAGEDNVSDFVREKCLKPVKKKTDHESNR